MKKILISILFSILFFSFLPTFSSVYACSTNFECAVNPHAEGCVPNPRGDPGQQKYICSTSVTNPNSNGPDKMLCPGEIAINTAIGCIPVLKNDSGTSFMAFILRWAIGVGGGIAFLLIVYAGFMIMTAAGNPERLKAGQELLTSAISGIILLIFSVFILNVIGVKILQIPGFG